MSLKRAPSPSFSARALAFVAKGLPAAFFELEFTFGNTLISAGAMLVSLRKPVEAARQGLASCLGKA
ncbi:MAG: hypothetical protein ACP5LS_04360 [Thermoprotei archaeon]